MILFNGFQQLYLKKKLKNSLGMEILRKEICAETYEL